MKAQTMTRRASVSTRQVACRHWSCPRPRSAPSPVALGWLQVASSKPFEVMMVCMIWVSSALLPFEADPQRARVEGKNQYEQEADPQLVMSQFFGFVFILEMVLKIVVMGFALGPTSYLRDDWNIIDFVVVMTTVLSMEYPELTVCKVFRAFRPLRIISHEGHLRVRTHRRAGTDPA